MPESHWSSRDCALPRRDCFGWIQEHPLKVRKLKENDIKHKLPPAAMQCPVILCCNSINQAVCKELQELGIGLLLLRGGASPKVHPSDYRNEHQRRSATRGSSSQCESCSVRKGWLRVISYQIVGKIVHPWVGETLTCQVRIWIQPQEIIVVPMSYKKKAS